MGLSTLANTYFNPTESTKQLPDNSWESNTVGIIGFGLLATAAIGHLFLKARPQNSALVAGAGALLVTSYQTEKSGYAWLVAAAALGGLTYQTVDAIQNGRFWVNLNIDIGDIIRAVRETQPQRTY